MAYLATVAALRKLTCLRVLKKSAHICLKIAAPLLKSLFLKDVESIWYQVFKNCTSLKSVTLNDGLMYIYDEAFGNCSSLSDIELPESIQKVSSTIFLNCDRIGNMYDHFAALNNIKRKMVLTIDKDTAKVGNIDISLGSAPQIVNNRTMLPARPVADFIGAKTDWSELDETVTIHSNNNNIK